MQPRIVAIGAIVLVAVIGVVWWSLSGRLVTDEAPPPAVEPPAQPTVPSEPATMPEAITPAPPPVQLPPLNESDEFVRTQVGALSERLSDWLVQDDLVRRFAVVVDNAAVGELPRRQLGFLAPSGKYAVREIEGRLFVDPAGYARFDPFVESVLSVPPEQAAAMLRTLAPLLREGLAELGQNDPDPIAAVRVGIRQALQTPEPDGDIELAQPKVLYVYADQGLESLLPLQKQLLRMGPANVARVKAYLNEVLRYL